MSARLTGGYTLAFVLLGATVLAAPRAGAVTWSLAGGAAVGALLYGVSRHHPMPRRPWLLLAGGVLAQATGDVAYALSADRAAESAPAVAQVCYLAMFPLLTAGLLGLARPAALLRDRPSLIDLLTFTSVAALLLWTLLVGPALAAPGLSDAECLLLASFAVGDLVLVGTVAVLLLSLPRSPALILLSVGAVGMLTADLLYGLAEVVSGWQPGSAPELGWLLLYGTWGVAALHPSMAALGAPAVPRRGDLSCRRRTVLVLACLVPPAVLLVEALRGQVRDGLVIAVVSAALFGLVYSRLSDAVESHRESVQRERHLREACAALVSVTAVPEVGAAVRAAVARLMPLDAGHRMVFAVDPEDGVQIPGAEVWGLTLFRQYRSPGAPAVRRSRLLRTFTLHPALIELLGGFKYTLACPLVLAAADDDEPRVGALFVAADPQVLEDLRDAMEVLAAQVTLTLARINLTDRVHRRDGEGYFRAVSQNAADVVLIVDDDDRIRYASPSLADLVGAVPAAFSPLTDLVHPDGREQVGHTLRLARLPHDPDGVRHDWILQRPDGTRLTVEVSCRDLRQDRMVHGLVITMRDVTERRQRERELIGRAVQDSAPGKNRRSVANRFRAY